MVASPFLKFSKKQLLKSTIILVFSTILLACFMLYLDSFLINKICSGIVDFQLAKDLSVSKEIINSWNETSKIACGISLGIDFLFLISYCSLIAILIHQLNEKLWRKNSLYYLGAFFIFITFFAGVLDAIENLALIELLLGSLQQKWTSISYYCAIPKFIIIGLGILYIFFNSTFLLLLKLKK